MLLRTLVIKLVSVFDSKGYDEAETATKDLGKSAAKTEKQVDKLDDELEATAKSARDTGRATDKAGTQIKGAGNKAAQAGRQVGKLDGLMSKAAAGIASLGPLLAAAGLAALISGVGDAIAFVGDETARLDRIAKGAQQSGLGSAVYQQLDHIANLTGASIDNLDKGVNKLNVELAKIGRGATTGPAVDALKDLGLAADALEGQGATEQLAILSEAMRKLPSDAERSRVAFQLLGEDGKKLVPLLNSGADAIRDMTESVGKIFTDEELSRAEAYQDSLANLNKVVGDIKGEIAIGAAPVLQGFVEDIGRATPPTIALFKSIGEKLGPAITRLVEALEPLVGDEGPEFLNLVKAYIVPLKLMADGLALAAEGIAFLVEVGTEAITWVDAFLDRVENNFPRAFAAAESAITAILSPLETARAVVAEIFDFIEASAGQIAGVASTIGGIRSALGISKGTGSTGGSTFLGQSTTAGNAGAGAAAQGVAKLRNAEARERARITAQANADAAEATAIAATRPRRRRRSGGSGRSAAPAKAPGLLEQLGLTSPGAVLEGRPAPQTLTIIVAPVIKLIEMMTINVSGVSSEGGPAALADAASQVREAIFVRIADLPALVQDIFTTDAKALQAAASGGKTLQGAG